MTQSLSRLFRRLTIAVSALIVVVGLAGWCLYHAARQVPEFYRVALEQPAELQHEQGEKFERQALALHNQAYHDGRWTVRFTEEEINGWLAVELPAKFPRALPPGISAPRVAFEKGRMRLALRLQRGEASTVLSAAGEAHLTAEPNEIAVRIDSMRAGLLPVPLSRFLEEISQRAAQADLPLRWTEIDGSPVALIRLPLASDEGERRRLVLENVSLEFGALAIAGRTERLDSSDHQSASHSTESEAVQR